MKEDAVHTALHAFGLSPDDQAVSLELTRGQDTALARANIMEDSVVEHDARTFPEYELIGSEITGRAVFEKGRERLEVFTANRRSLKKVFGVDLVYLNATRHNIVMVQYKMLNPHERKDRDTDWVYRPDAGLDSEIKRMRKFSRQHAQGPYEYRLNSQIFYLKFVKRDGCCRPDAAITTPPRTQEVHNHGLSRCSAAFRGSATWIATCRTERPAAETPIVSSTVTYKC